MNGPREQVFSNIDMMHHIFSACEIDDVLCIARVDRSFHDLVQSYTRNVFHINRLLSRFFPDPDIFRILQRQTATLISGLQAYQFLDRGLFGDNIDLFLFPGRERDIGLYLLDIGYRFVPHEGQRPTFEEQDAQAYHPDPRPFSYPLSMWRCKAYSMRHDTQETEVWEGDGPRTSTVQVSYHFSKKEHHEGDKRGLTIRLMICGRSPIEAILRSAQSSADLNVITHDKAYSAYPLITFAKRVAFLYSHNYRGIEEQPVFDMSRYRLPTWSVVASEDTERDIFDYYVPGDDRWFCDRYSWAGPLSMVPEQKYNSALLSMSGAITSTALSQDPVTAASWFASRWAPSFSRIGGYGLRYSYVIARDVEEDHHLRRTFYDEEEVDVAFIERYRRGQERPAELDERLIDLLQSPLVDLDLVLDMELVASSEVLGPWT